MQPQQGPDPESVNVDCGGSWLNLVTIALSMQGCQGAAKIMRAAGATRIMLMNPDLCWDRPAADQGAASSSQDEEAGFEHFLQRVNATISHPGTI